MEDALFSVEGQVVLVSGGSRGIGKGLAKGFAERGARVYVTGRSQETLDAAAAEIGHDTRGLVCDVTDLEQIQSAVAAVVSESGRIDTLLNVAGVNRRQPAETFTPDDFDFVVDTNLRGAFLVAIEAGKEMLKQGGGAQINIDSLNTYAPLVNVAPYAMSKCGVVAMTRALATEWGGRGVRVNSIAPGFILTELTQQLWSDQTLREWGRANTPMTKALGTPEDLVGAAVFLASHASQWMTGQVVRVDGGFSAGLAWPIPG